MPNDKQDEKSVEQTGYEPQSDEKQPEADYSAETNPRRRFLKTAIKAAVAVGLGGIIIGKDAVAHGLERLVNHGEGDSDLKKVTRGYYNSTNCDPTPCVPNCTPPGPPCTPNCTPPECDPNCDPNCEPSCNPNCRPKCEPCYPHKGCRPDKY